MRKISEVLKELWLDKKEFTNLLNEATWWSYSQRSIKVSEEDLEKFFSYQKTKWNGDKDRAKKIEELSSNEDSFLSGLGIDMSYQEEEEEQEKEEDSLLIKKSEENISEGDSEKKVFQKREKQVDNKKTYKPKSSSSGGFQKKESGKYKNSQKTQSSGRQGKFDWKTSQDQKKGNFKKSQQQTSSNRSNYEKKTTKQEQPKASDTLKKKQEVYIPESITVKEFAEKIWSPLSEVMKKLLLNKIVISATSSMDFDTALLIWEEMWVKVLRKETSVSVDDIVSGNLNSVLAQDKEAEVSETRSPIVTVMWHVDHWKTQLLDYLRNSKVVEWEAGGITQSIWASQIEHKEETITFVDTPGHQLFTSMRARWAKLTDVAIIVIAADDWIKQQTKEAIDHAKDANIPIIVAITKIDISRKNVESIKSQLSNFWLIPEDWWGDTMVVWLSSITWEWVDDLLDMILLHSEMLDLKFNPDRGWVGVVLEWEKDTKKWVTVSLILMTGSMKVWDIVVINNTYWRIKKMVDWKWKDIKEVKWGQPCMILWVHDVPQPWRMSEVVSSEKEATQKINLIKEQSEKEKNSSSLNNILDRLWSEDKTQLKLITKADTFGSLEALKYAISKIELPENVEIKIIHSGIGDFSNSDIMLWEAWGAVLLWFNVSAPASVKKKAENSSVTIKTFCIIYELIEYLDKLAKWMITLEEKEVYKWALDVLAVFYKKWNDMIIWGKVSDGVVYNGCLIKAFSENPETEEYEEVCSWKVTSLKKEKENVSEIQKWYECWIKVKLSKKVKEWDKIYFYLIETS